MIMDSDDLCSAARCVRPCDAEVSWVQCDGGCELWFHLQCVGLAGHESSLQDQDYICLTCKQRRGMLPPGVAIPDKKMAEVPRSKPTIKKPARPLATHSMPQQLGKTSVPSTTALPMPQSHPTDTSLHSSLMSMSAQQIASSLLVDDSTEHKKPRQVDLTAEAATGFVDVEMLDQESDNPTMGVVSVEAIAQDPASLLTTAAMVSERLENSVNPLLSEIDSAESQSEAEPTEGHTTTGEAEPASVPVVEATLPVADTDSDVSISATLRELAQIAGVSEDIKLSDELFSTHTAKASPPKSEVEPLLPVPTTGVSTVDLTADVPLPPPKQQELATTINMTATSDIEEQKEIVKHEERALVEEQELPVNQPLLPECDVPEQHELEDEQGTRDLVIMDGDT